MAAPRVPLVLAMVLLLSLAACCLAKKAGGKQVSITVLERSNRNTKSVALSTKYATPGDRFIFQWDIVTPKVGHKIGYDAGMCTSLFNGMSQCQWTTFLKKGTISVSGIVDDNKVKNVLPVIGGTGAFSGATGNVSQYTLVTNPAEADYQYLETFNLRLPEKLSGPSSATK